MRAVLNPRRFLAILLIFVFLGSAVASGESHYLKRITSQNAGTGVDMTARGSVSTGSGEIAPFERMESLGMGILIGDPPKEQSSGFSVSGTPNVDISASGNYAAFGVGAYSWGQSNTVTLDGGTVKATTTEDGSNRSWGGLTGLRLMSAPGGSIKVKSTADISVVDPGRSNKRNIGVDLAPGSSVYEYIYELDGETVPLYYISPLSFSIRDCTVTEADGSVAYAAYASVDRSYTNLVVYDTEMNQIATATIDADDGDSFINNVALVKYGMTLGTPPKTLTNLSVKLSDGSTATWSKVAPVVDKPSFSTFLDANDHHVILLDSGTRGYVWEQKRFVSFVESDTRKKKMEVELGGTVSVKGLSARGLQVSPSENTEVKVTLLSGAEISAKGTETEGIYVSSVDKTVTPPAVKGNGNVKIVAESDAGNATGVKLINVGTDISVALTGTGNAITVKSTTNAVSDDDRKTEIASAILIRPLGDGVTDTIRFEGDVNVQGGRENGVYSVPLSNGIARTEIIGDLTVTDSKGDGIYQAYNGDGVPDGVQITGITDGKRGEVFLRGNLRLVSARGEDATGVKNFDGLVVVDGDITVSGSGSLRGVYADSVHEDAVVVVTGEINASVPIRIPRGNEETPNNARVYVWKTDLDSCQNPDDRIGFVLKIDETLQDSGNITLSCTSAGNRFLDPIVWDGRTYYGAFAGDEIMISGLPSGSRAVVKDAYGNPVEVTEKDGKYFFLTPAASGAIVTAEPIITYSFIKGDGAIWTKGNVEGLDFTVKGSPDDSHTFERFTGIEVDGVMITDADYTASSGIGVKLRLKAEYLEKLSTGSHTIMVVFSDGSAEAMFTIIDHYEVPKTGDDADLTIWLGCVLAGLMVISAIAVYDGKRRKYHHK